MHDYHGEFEIHITVNVPSEVDLGRFQQWCSTREFKCVRIVLARGTHVEQPMATWRRRDLPLSSVVAQAEQYAVEMARFGFPAVRVKVEAALDNDDVPQRDADAIAHPPENYFEHHIKLLRSPATPDNALLNACETLGAHLSRNAFRVRADGCEERFVTLRSYAVGRLSSAQRLQELCAALRGLGEQIVSCESEYCAYDTNLELDAGWLTQPE